MYYFQDFEMQQFLTKIPIKTNTTDRNSLLIDIEFLKVILETSGI